MWWAMIDRDTLNVAVSFHIDVSHSDVMMCMWSAPAQRRVSNQTQNKNALLF